MDSIQKGVEVLRKSLEDFTGKDFVYANQDIVLNYPIGTLQRIFEKKIGFPTKTYLDTGEEVLSQVIEVSVQIDYIVPFSKTSAKDSIFSSRELLGNIQAGYYSGEWQSYMNINKLAEDVEVAIISFEDLTGPNKIDGGRNLWASRITANLNILSVYEKADFPFIIISNDYPLDIRLDLTGKVKNGEADTRDNILKICDEDTVKGFISEGAWLGTIDYSEGQIVDHEVPADLLSSPSELNNFFWKALVDNTDSEPSDTNTAWEKIDCT